MIKLFPESKRPWSDVPFSVQDHRNPYEIYFGLFGGGDDDGDSGGGGGQIGADDFADEDAGMMDGPSGPSGSADDGDSGGGGYGDGDFGQDDSASDATAGAGPSGPDGGLNEGQDNTGISDAAGISSDAVSDALDAALSDDIGDYSADDTNTDLADTLGFSGYTGDDVEASYGLMDAVTGTPDTTAAQQAVNAGFVTSAVTGRPVNTSVPGNYVTQANATPEEIAAAYAALSEIPGTAEYAAAQEAAQEAQADQLEALEAQLEADQELGFMSDVLDLDLDAPTEAPVGVQDIQAIDELSFGPPAQVTSFNDPQFGQITQTTNFDLMGRPTSKTTTSDLADFSKTENYSYGPSQQGLSSNVDPNYSMAPADQLDAQYGMPAGYFAGLDDLVDDDFAAMGNRPGAMSDELANALGVGTATAGVGYDPVTDLPYGLDFATNPQTGAQITTNLAGLTEQQRENQPFSMDVAQFIGSSPYGYELDPVTGNPIGQVGTAPFGILGSLTTGLQNLIDGPPETVQDLIERGAYTGMTGQNNDGTGEGGGEGGNVTQQATQVDPCPAGYELDPATNQCMPIDVVAPFQLGRREYGSTERPSLLGTPVSPFQSQLLPTAPDMSFFRPAVNPFGFARGGIVELPKK